MYNGFNKSLNVELVPTNIDYLRNIKDQKEIQNIKKACTIASKCYKHILSFVKPNMKEVTIENEILRYMKQLWASKESFDTIVASGKRGALPHGAASNKELKRENLLL